MKQWHGTMVVAIVALDTITGCELLADIGPEKPLAPSSSCPAPYPALPPGPDPGGDISFVAAIRRIDFGDKAGHRVGRNLDGLCSCHDGHEPFCKMAENQDPCDLADGIDNRMAAILGNLDFILEGDYFNSDVQSQGIQDGQWTLIGELSGWNGLANDSDIQFTWYVSYGIGGPGGRPMWAGEDVWTISPDSVIGGDITKPKYATKAYVADGQLVAETAVSEILVPLSGGRVAFTLRKPTFTGRIQSYQDGRYGLSEGLITGAILLTDMFSMVSSFRQSDGKPFCKNDERYVIGKAGLCSSADYLINGALPTTPCDAISFGLGFESWPARLGGLGSPLKPPALFCDGVNNDVKDDRCDL